MDVNAAVMLASSKGRRLSPRLGRSKKYKHWVSEDDLIRCLECEKMQGKIWYIDEEPEIKPELHPNCRCHIEPMETIQAGTATIDGFSGADWAVKYSGMLPGFYLKKQEASSFGWKAGKSPSNFIPGKMIGGDVYCNNNNHLPYSFGRIWYEADINYISGKRDGQRIVWSNDGLVFVTYDHYMTFYEII